MNDKQYLKYNQQLAHALAGTLGERTDSLPAGDPFRDWLDSLNRAATDPALLHRDGPELMSRLFTTYPEFAPAVPRDLLWFLGGECLHFMPDEEIAQHQALDELRAEAASQGRTLDYAAARAGLAGQH